MPGLFLCALAEIWVIKVKLKGIKKYPSCTRAVLLMPSVNSQVCSQNYNPQCHFSSLFLLFLSTKLRCCQVFASSKDSDKARARAAAFHLAGIFKKKRKQISDEWMEGRGKICGEKWEWPAVRECLLYCWNWLTSSDLLELKKLRNKTGLLGSWATLYLLTHCFPELGVWTSKAP